MIKLKLYSFNLSNVKNTYSSLKLILLLQCLLAIFFTNCVPNAVTINMIPEIQNDSFNKYDISLNIGKVEGRESKGIVVTPSEFKPALVKYLKDNSIFKSVTDTEISKANEDYLITAKILKKTLYHRERNYDYYYSRMGITEEDYILCIIYKIKKIKSQKEIEIYIETKGHGKAFNGARRTINAQEDAARKNIKDFLYVWMLYEEFKIDRRTTLQKYNIEKLHTTEDVLRLYSLSYENDGPPDGKVHVMSDKFFPVLLNVKNKWYSSENHNVLKSL